MMHFCPVFTLLTAAGALTTVFTTSAQDQEVKQTSWVNRDTDKASFVVFLYSESEPCLGTLIHKQWVLTAAHCFLPFLQIQIPASAASNSQKKELRPVLVVKHPDFTQDSVEHDLMLIKLQRPLKPSDGRKLAILPNTTDDKPGTTCTVFGWGWTWKEYNLDPNIQINQDVLWLSNRDCEDFSSRQTSSLASDNMFCAGSSQGTTHFCWEITAAPILCQNQLQGILSWSEGCVLKGNRGHYTKVSHYVDWILEVIHTH
ncbi:serine protease 58-like [Ochotona princeps]|uniref:serine protease 58-like n=1 Tax=Ochotona princeps TaxID=9978 RepID=UPI002714DFFD|nr:serine protease 58-like [Ochotona princeps]